MSRSTKSGKGDSTAKRYGASRAHGVGPGKTTRTRARYSDNHTSSGGVVQRKAGAAGGGQAPAATAAPAGGQAFTIAKQKRKPEGGIETETGGAEDTGQPGAEQGDAGAQGQQAGGAVAPTAAVQAKGDSASASTAVHQAANRGISGASGALPHLDAIQTAFGPHDVSNVEAHTNGAAADACKSINAEAYTSGSRVAFASASPSLHTAAHEAAHAVQQRGGVQLKGGVGQSGDAYEQHADAVADRVVQGASAVDLLNLFSGGSGGAAVQKQQGDAAAPTPAPTGGAPTATGGAPTATGGGAGKDHYEVELKAWIPHSTVVDPEEPARAQTWLAGINAVANAIANSLPGLQAQLHYTYNSHYRGDGHAGYGGGYRVLSKASFDWDGSAISGFAHVGAYGTTHRDYDYHAWFDVSAGVGPFRTRLYKKDIAKGTGVEADTATAATSGASGSASAFNLGMSSANPVVMTWAPTIDSVLNGTMTPGGHINMSYTTDLFPSHGIRVKKNGSVIKTQIINDASAVNGLGILGAANIGYRLTSFSNKGTTTA